jgi:hypothetical protein
MNEEPEEEWMQPRVLTSGVEDSKRDASKRGVSGLYN